jgi:predicted DNA-binding transcriptional regulator YafY
MPIFSFDVSDTTARVLALLALFQQQTAWTGAELAERLDVTDRTVRRDVERLRELGYPVEAAPGAAGGYRLGRGGRLPPLLLGDEEAMAVALGLRAAVDGSISGLEEAAVSVLARLDSLLPQHLAARVRAIHTATAQVDQRSDEQVDGGALVGLAQACERSQRVRFAYADRTGRPSDRLVEPHRLVRVGPRWYLVAFDADRKDWRTFRLDRLGALTLVGTTFTRVDPPDAVSFVRQGLRTRVWPFEARLRIAADSTTVAAALPGAIGFAADGDDATIVDVGSTSLSRMVRYLAGLAFPCQVIAPPELRAALLTHARALVDANA